MFAGFFFGKSVHRNKHAAREVERRRERADGNLFPHCVEGAGISKHFIHWFIWLWAKNKHRYTFIFCLICCLATIIRLSGANLIRRSVAVLLSKRFHNTEQLLINLIVLQNDTKTLNTKSLNCNWMFLFSLNVYVLLHHWRLVFSFFFSHWTVSTGFDW